MNVRELSDRAEIADLIARYARAIDTRSWDHLDQIFTADARIDYIAVGGIAGNVAEAKAYLAETLPIFSCTQHMLGLPAIDINGDRATAVTPCHNPMVLGSGGDARLMVCSFWYHHEFLRTAGGWRISALGEERCHMSVAATPSDPSTSEESTPAAKGQYL